MSAEPPLASDARYRAFLETITQLRPKLHRFCARMTGSALDGEDIVQEALFEAYRNLHQFDTSRPLKPWLFQIAHNRAIDFLRKRAITTENKIIVPVTDAVEPIDLARLDLGSAIEHLMISLPPKERACVLLKDIFDYSLAEIAEIVDSTPGGVKAALHRGRDKLARLPASERQHLEVAPELHQVIDLYVDRFNRRDWDGVRELIRADARLTVVDAFEGSLDESPYFRNYERLPGHWKMTGGEVDGEAVVIRLDRGADVWTASAIVRLHVISDCIDSIVDYSHCSWVVQAAVSIKYRGVSASRDRA